MNRFSPLRLLFALSVVPVLLSACQVVAGIEERKLDPHAGSDKLCNEYCDKVMAFCTDTHGVYNNREQCMGVCRTLPPGDEQEIVNENSVRCRIDIIDKSGEQDDCRFVGPGGGGQCGTDCEAYCTIYPKVCPDDYKYGEYANCLQNCQGLKDQESYNLKDDHEGDTIECRLVHSSSASVDPTAHCPHATIFPAEPWCIGKAADAPNCDDYCKIELAACQGSLAQYADEAQCKAACAALPIGTNADETTNSVGCRRYHSFNSTLLPETHCSHSGPSGDGHCGGNCEAYCGIVQAACPTDFGKAFADADACNKACEELPEAAKDSVYTLESAMSSKDYKCRMLHAVQALSATDDAALCASALGGGDCQ
jgi:hypothetical protein